MTSLRETSDCRVFDGEQLGQEFNATEYSVTWKPKGNPFFFYTKNKDSFLIRCTQTPTLTTGQTYRVQFYLPSAVPELLLIGQLVEDRIPGSQKIPRFLVSDVLNPPVEEMQHHGRLEWLDKKWIIPRNQYRTAHPGEQESFSIRLKLFLPLNQKMIDKVGYCVFFECELIS